MALELLGLGKDITRVRKQISLFMEVLPTEEGKKDIARKIIAITRDNPKLYKKFNKYLEEINYPHLLNLAEKVTQTLLLPIGATLSQTQYVVSPIISYIYEFLFTYENSADESIISESKVILNKIGPSVKVQFFLYSQRFSNLDIENEESLEQLPEKWDGRMNPQEPDFDYYFALTLRQTSTERINDFLEFQQGFWDEKEKFVTFLKAVLIGQEDFIPEKNRRVTQLWIEEQRLKLSEQAIHLTSQIVNVQSNIVNVQRNTEAHSFNKIVSSSNKKVEDNENREFDIPPFQAFTIPGRLRPKIIRRFFTFLSNETNGTDQFFITDEAIIKYFDSFGLQVPKSPLLERFDINLAGKRTKTIIYHCFYKLYKRHSTDENDKQNFAMFLKHTFTNFDNIENLKDLSAHIKHYKSAEKNLQFDINYYLGLSDIKKKTIQ